LFSVKASISLKNYAGTAYIVYSPKVCQASGTVVHLLHWNTHRYCSWTPSDDASWFVCRAVVWSYLHWRNWQRAEGRITFCGNLPPAIFQL